eukprot:TRINITY_DN26646_c0_g1_i2.p1 TRINITY_DN26646_c0_g1~~TRINITY_DN26646_c0_g1_i2.p1  ORF type:complete len:408 (-),score=65.04 TRINITY_DN26646_c0_g1_i2:214-1437(-)
MAAFGQPQAAFGCGGFPGPFGVSASPPGAAGGNAGCNHGTPWPAAYPAFPASGFATGAAAYQAYGQPAYFGFNPLQNAQLQQNHTTGAADPASSVTAMLNASSSSSKKNNAGTGMSVHHGGQMPSTASAKRKPMDRPSGPGWTCGKCGNHNHEGRTRCNMRSCQAFPDGTGSVAEGGAAGSQDGTGGWTCEKCGNFNREGRTRCNMRTCGAMGPWTCPLCHNKNYAHRDKCNGKNCNQLRPDGGGYVDKGAVPNSNFPAGSWVCLGCGNINFPTRTTCNAKACGKDRVDVDGGPPKPDAAIRSIILPGSWMCVACRNINWSTRTNCNRKTCGLPRDQADGGAPAPELLQLRVGSWTCRHCQNVNYKERTVCNRKSCGRPKEESLVCRPMADSAHLATPDEDQDDQFA